MGGYRMHQSTGGTVDDRCSCGECLVCTTRPPPQNVGRPRLEKKWVQKEKRRKKREELRETRPDAQTKWERDRIYATKKKADPPLQEYEAKWFSIQWLELHRGSKKFLTIDSFLATMGNRRGREGRCHKKVIEYREKHNYDYKEPKPKKKS